MNFGLIALVALLVLIFAAKQHRGAILLAVVAMVMVTGGPASFVHQVIALIPGLGA
ncbi:hypothetical protein [Streptomyces sp. NPDC007172]|uniref:hypothetical protein n=1 Tax=Streptomyces sp. NPDC007172 TaxID=3364776 RepID=UPI0036CF79FF